MKVKYFADTDTALVEFTGNVVSETKEISENICVDLDGILKSAGTNRSSCGAKQQGNGADGCYRG